MPLDLNPMSGVMFTSEKKSEKSPDFTGEIDVNGERFRIASWYKVAASGKEYMSLALSAPDNQESSGESAPF